MRHLACLVLTAFALTSARAAEPPPAIDPKADALLKRMGQTLAAARAFSFDAHSTIDQVLDNGQKVQTARNQSVLVRRPDAVAATVVGDGIDLRFVYDGKRVTVLNALTASWGATDAPAAGGIDATFDMLAEKFGLAVPLADVIMADPYKTLAGAARTGQDLGDGWVFDTKCRHLAYRQNGIDWQVWLEESGDRVLPRKMVITYKELPGHPQFTSFLSKWDLSAKAADTAFKVDPPPGMKQVEFGPATPAAPAPAANAPAPAADAPRK